MFDSHFRTLFLSTPAKLRLSQKRLIIQSIDTKAIESSEANTAEQYASDKKNEIAIPLSDILCLILETPQITLSASLLNALAKQKIIVYVCDDLHLPSGIFMPFLGHYKSLSIMESQIALSKQKKAVLWQKIIKAKLENQARLVESCGDLNIANEIFALAKGVKLGDSMNNEARGAMLYFPALFGSGFKRRVDFEKDERNNTINAMLNYGYAIVRSMIVRSICASGLNPALGIFHHNQFNPFNLADDIIEPYRILVDSLVVLMTKDKERNLIEGFTLKHRITLAQILNTKVLLVPSKKYYPLYRAIVASVQSITNSIQGKVSLELPYFDKEQSNGREVYESASDV